MPHRPDTSLLLSRAPILQLTLRCRLTAVAKGFYDPLPLYDPIVAHLVAQCVTEPLSARLQLLRICQELDAIQPTEKPAREQISELKEHLKTLVSMTIEKRLRFEFGTPAKPTLAVAGYPMSSIQTDVCCIVNSRDDDTSNNVQNSVGDGHAPPPATVQPFHSEEADREEADLARAVAMSVEVTQQVCTTKQKPNTYKRTCGMTTYQHTSI